MKGRQIQKLGEVVETVEERGVKVRDIGIELVVRNGVTAAFKRMAGGEPKTKPIVTVEMEIDQFSDADVDEDGDEVELEWSGESEEENTEEA